MSNTALDDAVHNLEEKADQYQEATNFEAKLTEYTGAASSVQSSVYGLKTRLKEMERFAAIYTKVFDEEPLDIVDEARSKSRRVLDRTDDDYWTLIDDGDIKDYEAKTQSARAKADDARQALREELNEKQAYWENRVETGRTVLALMPDNRDAEGLLSDIETFVTREMWDDSNDISYLDSEWQAIQRKLESGAVADWDEFQTRHDLDDETIQKLKRLVDGENVSFDDLNSDIVEEMLRVDELRSVLKVTL